jgi:hypothetical protein
MAAATRAVMWRIAACHEDTVFVFTDELHKYVKVVGLCSVCTCGFYILRGQGPCVLVIREHGQRWAATEINGYQRQLWRLQPVLRQLTKQEISEARLIDRWRLYEESYSLRV